MYISVFYCTVVPIGLIISIIGFIILYWQEKYVLLKRKSVKRQISIYLSLEMTEYLELIIMVYAVSNVLFKYEMVKYISWN